MCKNTGDRGLLWVSTMLLLHVPLSFACPHLNTKKQPAWEPPIRQNSPSPGQSFCFNGSLSVPLSESSKLLLCWFNHYKSLVFLLLKYITKVWDLGKKWKLVFLSTGHRRRKLPDIHIFGWEYSTDVVAIKIQSGAHLDRYIAFVWHREMSAWGSQPKHI